jgi:hypothetical protein
MALLLVLAALTTGAADNQSSVTSKVIIGAIAAVVGGFFTWRTQSGKVAEAEIKRRTAEDQRKAAEAERAAADARAVQAEERKKAEATRAKEQEHRAEEAERQKEIAERKAEEAFDQVKRIELELTQPKPASRNGRRCSVVLLGIGDSGKSEFIKRLTGNVVDAPAVKTTGVREWNVDIPFVESRPGDNQLALSRHVTCYITDYMGQNLGSLVHYFMMEQKARLSKMAFGHINVLCILVDLAEGDPAGGNGNNDKIPDSTRTESQTSEWNGQTLAAVWGLVAGPKFKHVIIFLNKCDAIPSRPVKFDEIAAKPYATLIKRVREDFPDQQLHVIAGSAKKNENMHEVIRVIVDASDPVLS